MPTTTYADPAFSVNAIQARTNAAGGAVIDVSGRELRLSARAYAPGVFSADAYKTTAAGGMVVTVGSGTAFTDLAVVGATAALGNYWVLLEPASQNFTVPAANLTNPRIDQIYLIVEDGSLKVVRLGYRQGDAAASPAAPGPDSSWEGSLLLSNIAVAAGANSISQGNITDGRTFSVVAMAAGGVTPTGALLPFAAATAPDGWLLCNGQAISRTTFARLFSVIGTTWGVGDGSTTFNVPDMRTRFPRGVGTGVTLGSTGGADTHTHTNPSTSSTGNHRHDPQDNAGAATNIYWALTGSGSGARMTLAGDHAHTQGATGSSGTVPPYAGVAYIIKT